MRQVRTWLVRLGAPLALLSLLALFIRHTATIAAALEWMEAQGPAGHALFAVFFLVATLGLVPASILEGGSGFLYGALWGIPVASALGTLGATCAFLLGRTLVRGPMERRIAADARWKAIDRAVGDRGLQLVFLLRLSPLAPFNIVSYALGATRVSVRDFALGTMLGHLFPVAVFAYTGSTVASAMELVNDAGPPPWASAVGLALTVVATLGVTRFARAAVERALTAPAS